VTTPHLTVRNSGYSGRGYADIFSTEEKPTPLPGVTTVLGALEKPGILQWSMNNMAAHATMHAQELLDKSEEQSYKSLQYYIGRMKESDFDDPVRDLRNSSNGVLNDLAELGTLVHEWIECYLTGSELPEVTRPEQAQMINAFLAWAEEHEIEVYATECTVYGQGYAGTADAFWSVDGVKLLNDHKTSRAIRDEHLSQLGALGAAHTMAVPCLPGETDAVEYKGEWFRPEPLPAFTGYSVLHLRPDEYNNQGDFVPAYCELVTIPNEVIDAGFELFKAALAARHGQRSLKEARKKVGFNA